MLCRYVFFVVSAFLPVCAIAQSQEQTLADAALKINSGNSLYAQGQLRASLDEFEKAYNLLCSVDEKDYSVYCLIFMLHCSTMLGETEKASALEEELYGICNAVLKGERPLAQEIAPILFNQIAYLLVHHNQIDEAISLRKQLCVANKNLYEETDTNCITNLCALTDLYIQKKDYANAQTTIGEACDIANKENVSGDSWLEILTWQSQIWADTGEIGLAVDLLESAELTGLSAVSLIGKDTFYSTYSDLLSRIGQFEKALTIELKQLDVVSKIYGKSSANYGITLMNISELYGVLGLNNEAQKSVREALDIFKAIGDQAAAYQYKAYSKLASHISEKDPEEAMSMRRNCVGMAQDIFGKNSAEYADALVYSVAMDDISDTAVARMEEALAIKKNLGLEDTNDYITHLSWLSTKYLLCGDWKRCADSCDIVLAKTMGSVWANFDGLTDEQRESLWQWIKPAIELGRQAVCDYINSRKTWDYDLIEQMARQAYTSILLEKGLLMESTKQLNEKINASDDPTISYLREKKIELKKQIDKTAIGSDDYGLLTEEVRAIDRTIQSTIMRTSNFADFVWTSCSDIQKQLKEGEVALEFFSYPVQNTTQYAAVWVTRNTAPKAMGLFTEAELDAFNKEGMPDIDNPLLYKTVWAVLSVFNEIKNAHTIYFAPTARLYTLPIESLVDSCGVRASERWSLVRLTSTRELLKPHEDSRLLSAALFGGLEYSLEADELIAESRTVRAERSGTRATGLECLRYGVSDLTNTGEEVDDISTLMDKCGINAEVFKGSKGTEEALRSLSDSKTDVLHIATHGFYWESEQADSQEGQSFLNGHQSANTSSLDYAMLRTGLLFSGANVALSGESLPRDVEDGILTAQELSTINLSRVKLVVLSACDTGLGEVNSEGVFGLQRGFKLAGAKSLLMSLWKVDDEATRALMTEFYRHLLDGKSKIESLRLAQEYVKSQAGWQSPEYWAGFILLDALD